MVKINGKHVFVLILVLTVLALVPGIIGTTNQPDHCEDDLFEINRFSEAEGIGYHIKGENDAGGSSAVCLGDDVLGADVFTYDGLDEIDEKRRVEGRFNKQYYYNVVENTCPTGMTNVLDISEYREWENGAYGGHVGTPGDYSNPSGSDNPEKGLCLGYTVEVLDHSHQDTPFEVTQVIYNPEEGTAERYNAGRERESVDMDEDFVDYCEEEPNCQYHMSLTYESNPSDPHSTVDTHIGFKDVHSESERAVDLYIDVIDHSSNPVIEDCEDCITEQELSTADETEFVFETEEDLYPVMDGEDYGDNYRDFSDNSNLYPLSEVTFCSDRSCSGDSILDQISDIERGDTVEGSYSADSYENFELWVQVVDRMGNTNTKQIGDQITIRQREDTACDSDEECVGECVDGVCQPSLMDPDVEIIE